MGAAEHQQLTFLVWESEVVRSGENQVTIRARKPLSEMPVKQAANILKVSPKTVRKLWRLGLLEGWKPGGAIKRKDGKGSNASLVLDSESVLRYKARQQAEAKREQAEGVW
jgi:hypothetical protein